MNKYDIVFIDIDDTLNPSNGKVSKKTKDVMTKLKKKGIKVVVNTGRSLSYAINKAKEANLSEYVIASNGTEVYNYKENKVIFSKPIDKKYIKRIYKYCKTHDMTLILNSLDKRFISNPNYSYNSEPGIYFDNIDQVLKENEVNQLVLLSSNFDRMLIIPNMLKEKIPYLKIIHSSKDLVEENREMNHQKEYYHDIVLGNTSKCSGIVELLDYLKISKDNSIAIGNGYDDICMCSAVKTSVAMGNANRDLKETASMVTDNVEDDGAAHILEKLCLKD